jgi:hypothetical protein
MCGFNLIVKYLRFQKKIFRLLVRGLILDKL